MLSIAPGKQATDHCAEDAERQRDHCRIDQWPNCFCSEIARPDQRQAHRRDETERLDHIVVTGDQHLGYILKCYMRAGRTRDLATDTAVVTAVSQSASPSDRTDARRSIRS